MARVACTWSATGPPVREASAWRFSRSVTFWRAASWIFADRATAAFALIMASSLIARNWDSGDPRMSTSTILLAEAGGDAGAKVRWLTCGTCELLLGLDAAAKAGGLRVWWPAGGALGDAMVASAL